MATRNTVNSTYLTQPDIVNQPGGSNTTVQYNKNGAFAGDTGLRYNYSTKELTVQGNIIVGGWVKGKIYTNTFNFFLTGGSSGQVLSTDGYGNLNWVDQSGGGGSSSNYSNSNVSAYLSTFTGNISAGNIKTNNLLYANGVAWSFAGTYSNSNVASYLPTYTGNITGGNVTVTGQLRGNTVYVTSTGTAINASQGNILTNEVTGTKVNLLGGAYTTSIVSGATASYTLTLPATAGTNGQVLQTNGSGTLSWVNQTGGANTGDFVFETNTAYISNLDEAMYLEAEMTTGGKSRLALEASDLSNTRLQGVYDVDIASNAAGTTKTWTFGSTGVLSKSDANGLVLAASYSAQIITDFGDNNRTWTFDGSSGELVLPGGNVLIDPTSDNFEVRGAQSINFEANAVVNIYTDTSNNGWQWQFGDDGTLTSPNSVVQNTSGSVTCNAGAPTVIYTGSSTGKTTLKLLIQVEGAEVLGQQWDTQSCEMVVARGLRNNTVVGSVYGLAYTSTNPLATFNAIWNNATSRIEITCTPASLTLGVEARVTVTEMITSA